MSEQKPSSPFFANRYLFTVSTDLLIEHQGSRIATLSSPYREEFAQRFAHYYMRIATPVPHRGEKF
jgi:hypothetical protein